MNINIDKLIRVVGSSDPFKIAQHLNIIVLYEELGSINGYFNKCYNSKFIHINNNLSPDWQYYVCCHELAHATIHQNINISFMESFTHFNKNKIEVDADLFAFELMSKNELGTKMLNNIIQGIQGY